MNPTFNALLCFISATFLLFSWAVRRRFASMVALFSAVALGLLAQPSTVSYNPRQQPPAQRRTVDPAPGATSPQAVPAAPRLLRTVVLDPAHGGADEGAHSATGVLEKDVVLVLAEALRGELERQGLHVVMTRQGNENPSFDQRAAIANAQPGAVFLSLHVSSTGPVGTAHAYYFDFSSLASAGPKAPFKAASAGLLPWDRAQEPYGKMSRRLAELVQVELAQKFRGSPEVPVAAAVHQLRSAAEPAIALEICSVAVPSTGTLEAMAPGFVSAVARAVASFRSLYESGGN